MWPEWNVPCGLGGCCAAQRQQHVTNWIADLVELDYTPGDS